MIPWTVARQAPLSMGILQARILEWVAIPSPGDLPNPGIKLRSPALQADSLPSEPSGKPKNTGAGTGAGSLSLLQGIFLEDRTGSPALPVDSLPAELPGKPLLKPPFSLSPILRQGSTVVKVSSGHRALPLPWGLTS